VKGEPEVEGKVAVAVPVAVPAQAPVEVIVGGQQDPIALKTTGGSSLQPALLQDPDSPSPLVFTVTLRLDPGEQLGFTVRLQQKVQLTLVPAQLSPKLLVAPVPASGVSK
jgi:hypothetical protein